MEGVPYKAGVGSFMYAMVVTRADIAIIVSTVNHCTKEVVWLRQLLADVGYVQVD